MIFLKSKIVGELQNYCAHPLPRPMAAYHA